MKQQILPIAGYHKVVYFEEVETGLKAIIAVHDATLGPGVGGCRMRNYETFEAALDDVTRLSKGMSYKNALGGIPFGGGKSVIIADPQKDKSPELMQAFGRAVEAMEGLYIGAQDSGISVDDLREAKKSTRFISGFPNEKGEGGNPSPYTAYGVWQGMRACAKHVWGDPSLQGRRVSILGLGSVGMGLAEHLHQEGAVLVGADVNPAANAEAKQRFGATIVGVDEAIAADVDIFSPCALGGSINADTIGKLKAKVVAGAANNQLYTPEMGQALHDHGILYAPDFVINAGGVISVGREWLGDWDGASMNKALVKIGTTLTHIFERSAKENITTAEIANMLAEEIIARGKTA